MLSTTIQDSLNKQEVNFQYYPERKQREFHDSKAKYRLFLGAWRSGKTYSGCAEAIIQSLAYPNNYGLIGRKDFTDLRDTTLQTFFEICPEEIIANYNKTEHHLYFKNKSEIIFRELKDGIGLGSLNLGFYYIDEAEEVQETIIDYLTGRLSLARTGRQCGWLTSNPPNKDHWLYRRFVENNQSDYKIIYASTYENEKYLPQGYVASLENMPLSWRKKYLEGKFGFTPDGKPFYDGFQENWHKRTLSYIPAKKIYRGIDFGFHHPACVWVQFDAKDRLMVLKELMGSDITIDKFARKIIAFENEHFPGQNLETYYDPAGEAKTDKSEKTSVEILAEAGIVGRCKQSTYRERKELIERQLSLLIGGIPALLVDESCHIINDGFLGGYHYPQDKQGKPQPTEAPEKDGYYEHLMNALEYIVVNILQVRRENGKSGYIPIGERFRFDT